MYLLDTTIATLFDPARRREAEAVIAWMDRHDRLLCVSVVTLMEIEAGLIRLRRQGRAGRAAAIEALRTTLLRDFSARLLPVDADVALIAAGLREAVRPDAVETGTLLIAATARARGLTVLSRTPLRFTALGVAALDPLAGLPPDAGG
ncbi:Toxin FitB [Methylobacterium crusticola]|uniref:Ribonuclease VapC n=1 Tax=Methylobacterium crusticola TaxID=1697972 RepID=A0ABQ4QWI6_9HYPH|nr:PIN domain-containing protein [Methylobacterium crusticola]GJD49105.1 Toxin FitB [Methylobacterium crusticola]